jgi:hypothetical protein
VAKSFEAQLNFTFGWSRWAKSFKEL